MHADTGHQQDHEAVNKYTHSIARTKLDWPCMSRHVIPGEDARCGECEAVACHARENIKHIDTQRTALREPAKSRELHSAPRRNSAW